MKHISGIPPSRAHNAAASISASSMLSVEPGNRTPAKRTGSTERLTPQKLSDPPGAVTGSHAPKPLICRDNVWFAPGASPPEAKLTSPCTWRYGKDVDQL